MCSKEGCRAVLSDQDIYIFGGRGVKALSKLEIYNPLSNLFTVVNSASTQGRYNHTIVKYQSQLVFYGG